jgi:hypothetical protein
MMPRSQIAALAVLLVGLGVVLALVGSGGVDTKVFTAQDTPTPSPTPTPEASAENWVPDESTEGLWHYTADEAVDAQISQGAKAITEVAAGLGVEPPGEGAPLPGLDLLGKFRDEFEAVQPEGLEPGMGSFTFDGPAVRLFDGVPVALARLIIAPDVNPNYAAGLDIAFAYIELGGDQINEIRYELAGEPNDLAYADFQAWLDTNASDFAAPAEAEGGTPTAEPTEAAETPSGEETPAAEPTEAGETPGEEGTPAAEPTEAGEAPGEEGTPAAEQSSAGPTETWMEVGPGQVVYTRNPNAYLQYVAVPVDEFAQGVGIEVVEGEALPNAEEILTALRGELETQIADSGLIVEEDAIQGPLTEDINGTAFVYLHLTVQPQAAPDGTPIPMQEIAVGIIETGENRITLVQYLFQGDPDPAIYPDFRTWLEENIARLSTLEIEEAAPVGPEPAPEATEAAEPAPEATPESESTPEPTLEPEPTSGSD